MRFWRRRFRITALGLRKKGYSEQSSDSFAIENAAEVETIDGLEGFRQRAKDCRGSRDTGAQLFTALLRALGLEARLIFSLCPLGYGFTKVEMRDEEGPTDPSNVSESKLEPSTESSDREANFDSEDSDVVLLEKEECPNSNRSSLKKRNMPKTSYDKDLKFPTFWTEVYSPVTQKWIAIDIFATGLILSKDEDMPRLEPKGRVATQAKQQMSYVIAYNADRSARDVTLRYLSKKVLSGKTKGYRMPMFEREVLSDRGELFMIENYDLFSERIMKCFQSNNPTQSARDIKEIQELQIGSSVEKEEVQIKGFPTSVIAYKNHPRYVLERHLRREDCILPGELPIHILSIGKTKIAKEEKVYSQQSVVVGKPAENWYKEGRVIRSNEQPLKLVPSRAVTVNRKREIENAKREGETDAGLVGLYAFYQTELYRPPPISDGLIPKNTYGNIDCFVPSMIPNGATHVPYRNAARLCKKLGIEYAEAVTGFEFNNKRAIPKTEGVLCAEENAEILVEACRQDEEEKMLKESGKREQICLALWRKFLIGLRIIERVEEEYGPDPSPPINTNIPENISTANTSENGEMETVQEEGGFLRE
ncbi:hypothetical protein ABW20_dc0107032 [Dactylellina cionopaga]|nr:hypothetical protein ABW20_dc0107032 [Dactylellina cionopaga]